VTLARGGRALAAIVLAAGCAGQSRSFSDELDAKPWEARKTLLPPYPKDGALSPLYVGGPATFSYFVDRAAVKVGDDGVVRYTLIARSASGASNVSYEGIRCGAYERRVYAYGTPAGWSQAGNSKWLPINRLASEPQTALADDIFCSERSQVRTTQDALDALARGNLGR